MNRYGKILGTLGACIALLTTACGSGVSEEDAKVRCDQEKTAKSYFFTQESYDQCVSCQEECGDECQAQATTPESYACPED